MTQSPPVAGPPPTSPPPPPGLPPKKKTRIGNWIVGAIVGVIVLGMMLGDGTDPVADEAPTNTTPPAAAPALDKPSEDELEEEVEDLVTPEMIVDVMMTPHKQRKFCNDYFALADYDFALEAFKVGYTTNDPPAEEVFDEIIGRC